MSRRAQWYQVFKQSRISVISVVLVISIFILSDQAQDVLRSLAQPGVGGKIILFEILLWIWAFTNWYGARFLLDHDFQAIRMNQKSQMRPRSLWGENFMPRFLGSAGLVGLGFALLYAVTGLHDINDMHYERVRWLGWINMPGGILFYFLVTVRRPVLQHLSALARRTSGFRWVPAYSPRIARVSDFSEFPLW
ncbi:MAG: hypothetical protein HY202_09040, partial [Nitrospirae bacterium]|nr:hypothetical protein [Nitrospirota bacterium]